MIVLVNERVWQKKWEKLSSLSYVSVIALKWTYSIFSSIEYRYVCSKSRINIRSNHVLCVRSAVWYVLCFALLHWTGAKKNDLSLFMKKDVARVLYLVSSINSSFIPLQSNLKYCEYLINKKQKIRFTFLFKKFIFMNISRERGRALSVVLCDDFLWLLFLVLGISVMMLK